MEDALGADISEAEFWQLTPWQARQIVSARARTARTAAITTAWWSHSMKLEIQKMKRLKGLNDYLEDKRVQPKVIEQTANEKMGSLLKILGVQRARVIDPPAPTVATTPDGAGTDG